MSRIAEAFSEIATMPYFCNYSACSGAVHNIAKHEDAIEDTLRNNGFKEHYVRSRRTSSSAITKKKRDLWLENPSLCDLPPGVFIAQPCGTHNSPDFIVKDFGGKVYFLECKSVKGGTPMYNSGVPKPGYIYILTSKKHNRNTFYRGIDVLPSEVEELFRKHIEESRNRDEKFNEKVRDLTAHNICYYTRPMIQHQGGICCGNDYFENDRREEFEQNVLDLLNG